MYYLLTRYYDPATGRFINSDSPDYLDPRTIGGLNLYAYCNNNPVMNVDPSGCNPIILGIVAGVIVGIAGIFGAIFGANLPEENEEDEESTATDTAMNSIKCAFVFAHSAGVAIAGVGAFLTLCNCAPVGAQLFAWGSLYAMLFQLLLISFGIEVQSPELDPSDIYKPDLPSYK